MDSELEKSREFPVFKADDKEDDMSEMLASIYSAGNPNSEKNVVSEKTAVIGNIGDIHTEKYDRGNDDEPYTPEDPDFEREIKEKKADKRREIIKKQEKKQNSIKQRRRTFAHIFGSVILLVFIVSVASFLSYFIVRSALDFTGVATNEFEIQVEIPENATTEEIAEILSRHGLIDMPELFMFYSRVSGADGKYLNGLFSLDSTMSYSSIVSSLQEVSIAKETVTVRIQEGMTSNEVGALLEENGVCKASDFENFYKTKRNKYNFEKRVLQSSMKFYQLEGYLFPDTYEFYVANKLSDYETQAEYDKIDTSINAEDAASKIYSNYNSKITKEMYKRINEMGFTLDEFMTLASMVQAEAGTNEDMLLVASVFLNRLKSSGTYPFLQSDVTIIYANEVIKPRVTSRNEGIYGPIVTAYNSYESEGLPPGPICNPGISAMEAVLNAPNTDYYYFCANEETLEMFYASNIAQHEANLILAGLA